MTLRPTRRAIVLGALAGLAASPLTSARRARAEGAKEPSLDDLLARIAAARTGLKTLAGPFTQTRKIGLLAQEVRSTGTMTLVRPDRLRWELAPPDEITYWITPEGLAYRSKTGQGKVRGASGAVAASLDDLRALLGGDLGRLRARYDLKTTPTTDGTVAFEATPKAGGDAGAAPRVQRITFALAGDLVRPVRATLYEGPRDRTEIVFGALERDVPVDPAKMRAPL